MDHDSQNARIGKNQILLTFESEGHVNYIRLVCRRTGTSLERYIFLNFEWDDHLPCIYDQPAKKITDQICEGCDYLETCPDGVKGEP